MKKNKKIISIITLTFLMIGILISGKPMVSAAKSRRQMENLDRGLIAMKVSNGVYLGWRLLGTDSSNVGFNIYRDGNKINSQPITQSTNYVDGKGSTSSRYYIRPIINGIEQKSSNIVQVTNKNYISIPLKTLSGHTPNDASVGDLDGDGEYEIVIKQEMSPKDPSQNGYTGQTKLEAYKLDGTFMWRIDLGKNIREGAHYTPFIVYDLDGDGKAEIACKTADGTKDGKGKVIGSSSADYRNSNGRVLSGSEYLTIFDGITGAALATTNFDPARGKVSDWGDSYGNRVDRLLAAVAYIDGKRPSLIMTRGYYEKSVLVAWNWRNNKLSKVWKFDTSNSGNSAYKGQGNHNLSVADVDNDGKDEIIYGACAIDHDGDGLYTTGLGHGDAMHLSDMDPNRSGLEVWQCHEPKSNPAGSEFRDAKTGRLIFGIPSSNDVGRAMASDIDPRYRGYELWTSATKGVYNVKGQKITSSVPSINFGVWWDADYLRELLDGDKLDKWDYINSRLSRIYTLYKEGVTYNNGSKKNPCISGDILGDWREEIVLRSSNNKELRIFTTTIPTTNRLYTLMHNPTYRLAMTWQNVGYNQPPHPDYYLGDGMSTPSNPNIYLAH